MTRKKAPAFVVGENGERWNLDDFDLDSHRVEALLKERFEMLAEDGVKPESVSIEIQQKFANYLERMKERKENWEQKVGE